MSHQEPSTFEFLMNLSRCLSEGEGLAEAIAHADSVPDGTLPEEQAGRLEERLRQMRAANRAGLHQDDGA